MWRDWRKRVTFNLHRHEEWLSSALSFGRPTYSLDRRKEHGLRLDVSSVVVPTGPVSSSLWHSPDVPDTSNEWGWCVGSGNSVRSFRTGLEPKSELDVLPGVISHTSSGLEARDWRIEKTDMKTKPLPDQNTQIHDTHSWLLRTYIYGSVLVRVWKFDT